MERYNPFAPTSTSNVLDKETLSSGDFDDTIANKKASTSTNNPSTDWATSKSGARKSLSRENDDDSLGEDKDEENCPAQVADMSSKSPIAKPNYSTSFPDPLGDILHASEAAEAERLAASCPVAAAAGGRNSGHSIDDPASGYLPSNKARTTASDRFNIDSPPKTAGPGTSSGFSSFLSRATSVTSSSVISDRVSGAMGGMLNAVDSISSQIQQVVPSNLYSNERSSGVDQITSKFSPSGGASGAAVGASSTSNQRDPVTVSRQRVVLIIDDPASTDWLVKFGQYQKYLQSSSSSQSNVGQSMLNSILNTSASLLAYSTTSLTSSSGINAQSSIEFCGDLIVQADYRDLSVLANQSTGLATVCIIQNRDNLPTLDSTTTRNLLRSQSSIGSQQSSQGSHQSLRLGSSSGNNINPTSATPLSTPLSNSSSSSTSLPQPITNNLTTNNSLNNNSLVKIIRPEYVIVRQRPRDKDQNLLAQIVKGLDYCSIPLFEEPQIWFTFQERQLIFARLLRIQRSLGRENFPLIPQVFCQTHHDLINYIQQSAANITLPCNVILGNSITTSSLHNFDGKIRVDSLDMLRHFAYIMASSGLTCTIEPYLDIKQELIVQKMGSNLRVYRRSTTTINQQQNTTNKTNSGAPKSPLRNHHATTTTSASIGDSSPSRHEQRHQAAPRLGLGGRQSSLVGSGTKVLSNLISSGGDKLSSITDQRRDSMNQFDSNNPNSSCFGFERLQTEVSRRHRTWLEAVSQEFNNNLIAFSLNIVISSDDREYVVGLNNCSMNFVGSAGNQDEDKRNFVELMLGHINAILPKHSTANQQTTTGSLDSPKLGSGSSMLAMFDEFGGGSTDSNKLSSNHQYHHQPMSPSAYQKSIDKMQQHQTISNDASKQQHHLRNATTNTNYSPSQRHYGQLGNRSQSVIMNETNTSNVDSTFSPVRNMNGLNQSNRSVSLNRRSSERSGASSNSDFEGTSMDGSYARTIEPRDSQLSYSPATGSSSQLNDINQQQQQTGNNNSLLFGQSIFDSTSTAFNSFQRQSRSFFRRLDSLSGNMNDPTTTTTSTIMGSTNTPPQSAKSDRDFHQHQHHSASSGFKSQSVDSSGPGVRSRPPKPPPPPSSGGSFRNRTRPNSVVASGTGGQPSQRHGFSTPTATPNSTRQNSFTSSQTDLASGANRDCQSNIRAHMMRQNSALSAFERFEEANSSSRDLDVASTSNGLAGRGNDTHHVVKSCTMVEPEVQRRDSQNQQQLPNRPMSYDSGSITSGDSSSTGGADGIAANEDTMKNLKKTFASIFGDKPV